MAAGLGARVVVLDINLNRLRSISSVMPNNVQTVFSSPAAIEQYLKVVGACMVLHGVGGGCDITGCGPCLVCGAGCCACVCVCLCV